MKKILLIIPLILLSSCWTQQKISNSETNKQKLEKVKWELKKAWFTGEKLEKIAKEQEKLYKKIASFTWDKKNTILIQQEVLPKLVKNPNIPKECKITNSTNFFIRCIAWKKVNLDKIIKEVPANLQWTFKKLYYKQTYSINPQQLTQKATNQEQIWAKEQVIKQMKLWWQITSVKVCNQIPDKQVQDYCKNLFK